MNNIYDNDFGIAKDADYDTKSHDIDDFYGLDKNIELKYDPYLWMFVRSDIIDMIQPYVNEKLDTLVNQYSPTNLFEIFIDTYTCIIADFKSITIEFTQAERLFYSNMKYIFFGSNSYFPDIQSAVYYSYMKEYIPIRILHNSIVDMIDNFFCLYEDMRKIRRIKKFLCNNFKLFYSMFEPFIQNINALKTPKRQFTDITKIKEMSSGEKVVFNYLTHLSKKYQLFFIHNFRFKCFDEIYKYSFDFFCILIHNNLIYPFVIEFDGGQHFSESHFFNTSKIHYNDIIKQFYLSNINVHLLRISDHNKVISSIDEFIYFLINNPLHSYITFNYIHPNDNFKYPEFYHHSHTLFINLKYTFV